MTSEIRTCGECGSTSSVSYWDCFTMDLCGQCLEDHHEAYRQEVAREHLDNLLYRAREHECSFNYKTHACWQCDEIDEAEAFFRHVISSGIGTSSARTISG